MGIETNGIATHHRVGLTAMTTNNIIVWGSKPMASQPIIVWS
jgi:NO-binding membrane sensor protein with MHYT domain